MSHTDIYREIIDLINQTVKTEKIFVLATTQIEKQTQSIFAKPAIKKIQATHLYLLILISKEQHCIYYDIQNQIESLCQEVSSITAIAMEMEVFNEWLKEGHPFAVQTKTKALLIYDSGRILIADHNAINEKRLFNYRNDLYQMGIENVKSLNDVGNYHDAAVEGLMTILINEIPSIFHSSGYDNNPPVEKIEALLHALYAPYKTLTAISGTVTK